MDVTIHKDGYPIHQWGTASHWRVWDHRCKISSHRDISDARPTRRAGKRRQHERTSWQAGLGTRLNLITLGTSKAVLVYDKPMTTSRQPPSCWQASPTFVITTPHDAPSFHRLLGDGKPAGREHLLRRPARAQRPGAGLVLGATHVINDAAGAGPMTNIFYGSRHGRALRRYRRSRRWKAVFAYHVTNLYGVVEFDEEFNVPLGRGEAREAQVELREPQPCTSTTTTWSTRS